MNKADKKILKAAMRRYGWILMGLSFSILLVYGYETKGYFWIESLRFSGEAARIISWSALFITLAVGIHYTLFLFSKVKTKEDRENLSKELPNEPRVLICVRCGEPFFANPDESVPTCPQCGSAEHEELDGYYERHPEKRAQ